MQAFPHHYSVTASARAEGDVSLESAGRPIIGSAAPVEFDGLGDRCNLELPQSAGPSDRRR